jgi:hypothetical protein
MRYYDSWRPIWRKFTTKDDNLELLLKISRIPTPSIVWDPEWANQKRLKKLTTQIQSTLTNARGRVLEYGRRLRVSCFSYCISLWIRYIITVEIEISVPLYLPTTRLSLQLQVFCNLKQFGTIDSISSNILKEEGGNLGEKFYCCFIWKFVWFGLIKPIMTLDSCQR